MVFASKQNILYRNIRKISQSAGVQLESNIDLFFKNVLFPRLCSRLCSQIRNAQKASLNAKAIFYTVCMQKFSQIFKRSLAPKIKVNASKCLSASSFV